MIEIIIGFDMFDCQFFDGNIPSGNIYRMELMNSKVDEIKIDTGNDTVYNNTKSEWGLHTQLLCKFKDNIFEAGNITLAGMPIEYIRIKKRKEGELTWQNYKDLPFNPNQTDYKWSDFFVESLTDYQYAVLPVGAGGVEGIYGIKDVECEYEDIWLFDGNNQHHLIANIQKGDIQSVSPSSFIETLGSKYPYEIKNGNINYRKGNLRATLISDSTLNGNNNGNGIDRKAEKELRNSLYIFLTNSKPKVYKDSDGYYILVSIKADSVKLTPNNDLSRQIYDLSFDFYEIGDSNSISSLKNCGLLK